MHVVWRCGVVGVEVGGVRLLQRCGLGKPVVSHYSHCTPAETKGLARLLLQALPHPLLRSHLPYRLRRKLLQEDGDSTNEYLVTFEAFGSTSIERHGLDTLKQMAPLRKVQLSSSPSTRTQRFVVAKTGAFRKNKCRTSSSQCETEG